MHYKNGREAKPGDPVINLVTGQAGVLHSTVASATSCNGRMAATTPNDPWITVGECLHIDDVKAATVPDSSKV